VDTSHISSAAKTTARREMAMVPRLLKSDEQVLDVCHGNVEGGRTAVFVLTDRRLIYLQRRRLWGSHVESIPLAHVRSAADQIGIRHATVKLDAGGRVFELVDVDRALARIFCSRVQSALETHERVS
jgi:Bacterial PH domain